MDNAKGVISVSEMFSQNSAHNEKTTPDTCRQTAAPISATLIHNNSVSSQRSGINYYYPRNSSYS